MPVRFARLSGYRPHAVAELVRDWHNRAMAGKGLARFVPPPQPSRSRLIVCVDGSRRTFVPSGIVVGDISLLFAHVGDDLIVAFFDRRAGDFLPAVADNLVMVHRALLGRKSSRAHIAFVGKLVRIAESIRADQRVNA